MAGSTTTPPQVHVQPCRYKTGKTLGAGSYSVVKECVHIDTGRYYAAKVINKRLMAGREHMIRNEIAVLKKVSMGHQNILTLVDYFETMNNLYLVTDLALGGELFDRICRKGSYYESDAADLVRATLSAVAYLHDHGIVHRDLKPENLLFRTPEDNADLLIADFGLSRIMDEEQFHVLTTTCGTPGYMAPEIFSKTGHGKPVDLWAIGVITYFLLCGYMPFDRNSNLEEMQAILVADYSFTPVDYWRGISDSAKDFVTRCLTVDPNKRITAHQALSHPWLREPDDIVDSTMTDASQGEVRRSSATGGPPGAAAGTPTQAKGPDLLPTVKKNFNARVKLHAAIDTIRAINQLRAGGAAAFTNGAMTRQPNHGAPNLDRNNVQPGLDGQGHQQPEDANQQQQQQQSQPQSQPQQAPFNIQDIKPHASEMEGVEATGQLGHSDGAGEGMDLDPRGHGRGQSEAQIQAQEKRIKETMRGLWSGGGGGGGSGGGR